MSIIERLAETAQEEELPFLLIGGYAVSFHGYSRFTKDIDVLIRKADLPEWTDLLNRVNYSPVEESPAFVRFESSDVTLPPIDVIMVIEGTFEKLNARVHSLATRSVRIPFVGVDDLIALKIHALKREPMRQLKHFVDVVEIARMNRIELPTAQIPECLNELNRSDWNKEPSPTELRSDLDPDRTRVTRPSGAAASSDATKASIANDRCLRSSDLDFDLPVDPTFVSEAPRLTFEQHVRFCEEMLAYNRQYGIRTQPRLVPVSEEFVL